MKHEKGLGGPATESGKAISRLNATKHGALSEVIPEHEVAAYTQHLELVRQHFQPDGYLENFLTERVANLLWRIARIARYEQAVITRNVDSALQRDGMPSLRDLIEDLGAAAINADPVAEALLDDARTYIQQTVSLASLPVDLVDKVPRYEAHLDRSLKRTLEQLKEIKSMNNKFVSQNQTHARAGTRQGKGNG